MNDKELILELRNLLTEKQNEIELLNVYIGELKDDLNGADHYIGTLKELIIDLEALSPKPTKQA